MIAIDFGTTNSSLAILSEGETSPRVQSLEYGDTDSYNPNVLASAVCAWVRHKSVSPTATVMMLFATGLSNSMTRNFCMR